MTKGRILITWLYDTYDCETCGSDWAEGAIVHIDGEEILHLQPIAHCYDGVTYTRGQVYQKILDHLGYVVEEVD